MYKFIAFLIFVQSVIANECELPNQIVNGNWTVLDKLVAQPGDRVSYDVGILITCIDGFKAYPASKLTCRDLLLLQPKCISTCPSLGKTATTTVSCKFSGNNTSCQKPYHGTIAIKSCIDNYENRNNDRRAFTCHFGKWDFEPNNYECEPICGVKFVKPQEYIINGKDANPNEYTWQVAIYEKKGFFKHICGGTIITPKVTLSAAHCFQLPNNPELYFLGAGKTYRNYLDARDEYAAQYRNLSKIIIPSFFEMAAESRYDNDIAILVLTTSFQMTQFVLPACLDKNELFNNDHLINTTGVVTGWGFTESNRSPSDTLQFLEVDYRTNETCTLRFDFKKYYFPYVRDKICAGLLKQGKSVCKGDSGGGLVFRKEDDERYYVRGVVSIGPKKKGLCDESQYSLYTSIAFHLAFILQQLKEHNKIDISKTVPKTPVYENGCILPKIKNGRWELLWTTKHPDYVLKPGYPVRPGAEINIECNKGFRKYPESWNNNPWYMLKCDKGWNVDVQCKRFCPTIDDPGVNATCYFEEKNVTCKEPYDGAVALVKCKESYVAATPFDNPYRYCEDGFWSDDIIECLPANQTQSQ